MEERAIQLQEVIDALIETFAALTADGLNMNRVAGDPSSDVIEQIVNANDWCNGLIFAHELIDQHFELMGRELT
jgi:hypothetical protein